jgi:hypothetical protein
MKVQKYLKVIVSIMFVLAWIIIPLRGVHAAAWSASVSINSDAYISHSTLS